VQHQLYDVQQIVGSAAAFAALRGDGVVVAWGDVTLGGDVADAEERLQGAWGKAVRNAGFNWFYMIYMVLYGFIWFYMVLYGFWIC
jgi:hypothetical protein